MKRYVIAIIIIVFSVAVSLFTFLYLQKAPFTLSPEYYGTAEIQTIDINDLHRLIKDQESFGLFISQPSCQASADLEKHLNDFTNTYSIKIYEINFSALKDSNIIPDLRFYPSFAIFRTGNLVDFLEANSNEDASAYTSSDGFTSWFTQYIKLHV